MRNYKKLEQVGFSDRVLGFLRDGRRKNILFVGRVIPNKGHHDLIFLLSQYIKHVDSNVRLICVGAIETHYGGRLLKKFAEESGLNVSFNRPYSKKAQVVFTGSVDDRELASFYSESDVFVCLSDHEGFCVPLVEAMYFKLPILAHSAAAVPETLGYGGLLVDKTDPVATLKGLYSLLNDTEIRERYIDAAKRRFRDYEWSVLKNRFRERIEEIVGDQFH